MEYNDKKEKVLLPLRDTSNYEHASVGLKQTRRISSIVGLNDSLSKSREALNAKLLSSNNYGSTQMLNKRGSIPSLLDDIKEDKKHTKAGREMDMLLNSTHNILELGASTPTNTRKTNKEKPVKIALNHADDRSPKDIESVGLPDQLGSRGNLLSSRNKLDDTAKNTDLTKINDRRKSAGNILKLDEPTPKIHTKRKSVGNILTDVEKINHKNSMNLKSLSTELNSGTGTSSTHQIASKPKSLEKLHRGGLAGLENSNHNKKSSPAIFEDVQSLAMSTPDNQETKLRKVPNYK
ncbi:hypothetical protein HDV06_004379 [Boothiomyces sp. JEL0866]|nr:hypothetical protein HDV06_004379 [Boothiomyces sp. JEL0866]